MLAPIYLCLSVSLQASVTLSPELPIDCRLEENNKKSVEVLYFVKEYNLGNEKAIDFKFFRGYCENAKIQFHKKQDLIAINAWSDEFLFPWEDLPYGVEFELGKNSFHSLRITFTDDILEGKQKRVFPIQIERYRNIRMKRHIILRTLWNLTFERSKQGDVQVSFTQEY
jgi:hypothetical protein